MTHENGANPRLLREAVKAHGHKCCVCGRDVRDGEARRHTEPGPFGDGPLNFAAMCAACQSWLAGAGPAPARYVVHIHDGRRARETLRRAMNNAWAALVVVVYLALTAISVWLVIFATTSVWHALAATFLFVLLVKFGNGLLEGFFGRWRLVRQNVAAFDVHESGVPARHNSGG